MADKGTFIIRAVGPYRFDLSFAFYRRSRFENVDRFSDEAFVRPILLDETPILIHVPLGQDGEGNSVKVYWRSPAGRIDRRRLRRLLAGMFFLNFDLGEFYAHRLDPVMRRLTRRFAGFRPILTPTIFESAVWAIMGQQVNLQFAYRLKSRLVEKVNRSFEIDGERYRLFPTASDVARLTMPTLRAMQFSARKAEYLLTFARLVDDGKLDLEGLVSTDGGCAAERLQSIRGIGPWSANYILMRGAGHLDAFPLGDSGIYRAVMTQYRLKEKPDTATLLALAEHWRPYRSLASFYLWKSL
jgi:DNA-3-methyladenine glycosylase II